MAVGVSVWCPSRDHVRRSCSGPGPHPPPFRFDLPHHDAYPLVVTVSILYQLVVVIVVITGWGGGGISRLIGRILLLLLLLLCLLLLLLLFLLLWLKLGSGLCFGRVTGVKVGKWEKRKWWGPQNSFALTKWQVWSPQTVKKYWVMTSEWWCQTGWGILSDEWWVTEIEWRVMSAEKNESKHGLNICQEKAFEIFPRPIFQNSLYHIQMWSLT